MAGGLVPRRDPEQCSRTWQVAGPVMVSPYVGVPRCRTQPLPAGALLAPCHVPYGLCENFGAIQQDFAIKRQQARTRGLGSRARAAVGSVRQEQGIRRTPPDE